MSFISIDPLSIDAKMAEKMLGIGFSHLEGDSLSLSSNYFPGIIDFDELVKIPPPHGYAIEIFSRDIQIKTTTYAGFCAGAIHYYCSLRFYGPSLIRLSDRCSGTGPSWPKVGRIFGYRTLDVNRPVTSEDLSDRRADWRGYDIGDMTHRWYDTKNAIECAKRCIELLFRNYGEIEVEDFCD